MNKPSIICHIGMPKTGTSTLQRVLRKSRHELIRAGIYYPEHDIKHHGLLAYNIVSPEKFPRMMTSLREPQVAQNEYARFESLVLSETQRLKPSVLLFSSEFLYRCIETGYNERVLSAMKKFGGPISIVVYLRSPASFYLSALQQLLRFRYTIVSPKPYYKDILNSWISVFGRDNFSVNLYDKNALVGGDIVADFYSKYLTGLGLDYETLQKTEDVNEGVCAESIAILMFYRKTFHHDTDNVPNRTSSQLLKALRKAEMVVSGTRPRLRPEVSTYVERINRDDVIWLRNEWGIEFRDYDYHLSGDRDAMVVPAMGKLADVMQLDVDKVFALYDEVKKSLLLEDAQHIKKWNIDLIRNEL